MIVGNGEHLNATDIKQSYFDDGREIDCLFVETEFKKLIPHIGSVCVLVLLNFVLFALLDWWGF